MDSDNAAPIWAQNPQIFNRPDRFVEGWYWGISSHQVKSGQIRAVTLHGRELVIYRTVDGQVGAMDAYCPHMGAHLAEGQVDGDGVRCLFHHWKFARDGRCMDAPCLEKPPAIRQQTVPTAEQYGLIWVWTGSTPQQRLPFVPELEHQSCQVMLGPRFIKNCHPNVVMVNAIDANHFNTVHNLPVKIVFEKQELNDRAIAFRNTTRGGHASRFVKLIRPLYKNEITYNMCYWYGCTGTVTLGPDAFHFHIMFALRLIEGGKTEGQTVLITPKRSGLLGWAFNHMVLGLTQQVSNYFAKGDTRIFQTLRFHLKTPTRADSSILQFVHHIEQQPAQAWRSWKPIVLDAS